MDLGQFIRHPLQSIDEAITRAQTCPGCGCNADQWRPDCDCLRQGCVCAAAEEDDNPRWEREPGPDAHIPDAGGGSDMPPPAQPYRPDDVKVHHTKGCELCGSTSEHTHTQSDWRALIDSVGDRSGQRIDMPPAAQPHQPEKAHSSTLWWLDGKDTSQMSFNEVSELAIRAGDLRDEMVRQGDPPERVAEVDREYQRLCDAQREAGTRMNERRAERQAANYKPYQPPAKSGTSPNTTTTTGGTATTSGVDWKALSDHRKAEGHKYIERARQAHQTGNWLHMRRMLREAAAYLNASAANLEQAIANPPGHVIDAPEPGRTPTTPTTGRNAMTSAVSYGGLKARIMGISDRTKETQGPLSQAIQDIGTQIGEAMAANEESQALNETITALHRAKELCEEAQQMLGVAGDQAATAAAQLQ